ncbi:unnamed protein product [Echinostoma caproni]|uniref:CASPASE_P20 domain-containing protein n=1 Tax=Echinostoma caproni TaxID=27848 RepID=A0A183AAA9_9TREM|nr:unnamed protein product [Echinostoma caproni]
MNEAKLLEQFCRDGELQFRAGIHAFKPWCENQITDLQVFDELDAQSVIEHGQTVLYRLALSCFPHAQLTQFPQTITINRHGTISFATSREFLCKVSQKINALNALVVIQHCFALQEFKVIGALVDRFPPYILPHWNPSVLQVEENKLIELRYSILGKPTPLFYWCFHGYGVHNRQAFVDSFDLRHQIGLRIPQAGLDDAGEYYCCILKREDLGFFAQTQPVRIRVTSKVVSLQNLNSNEIIHVIKQFEQTLAPGVYGFVYLGSHGFRIHGHEYVLATDATMDKQLPNQKQSADVPPISQYQRNKLSLHELTRRGLISVDALTCRLNARSPSIAVLVVDACRQNYAVDQSQQWAADSVLKNVTALNFYNPSNLAVLYACQAGAQAYEEEGSVLCFVLNNVLRDHSELPVVKLLEKTRDTFDRLRLLKDKPQVPGGTEIDDKWDSVETIQQHPELRPPQPARQLATRVNVITIAGNTDRATRFDHKAREQDELPEAVWNRKLSDKIRLFGNPAWKDMWYYANAASNDSTPEWFRAHYVRNNVLRLEIDVDRTTGLPMAYFEMTELTSVWKPCRVELEEGQSRQYIHLTGHYRIVLVRDLQRLNAPYQTIRQIPIQVHRISSESFQSAPFGRRCGCIVNTIKLNCPPIVRAWYTDPASTRQN